MTEEIRSQRDRHQQEIDSAVKRARWEEHINGTVKYHGEQITLLNTTVERLTDFMQSVKDHVGDLENAIGQSAKASQAVAEALQRRSDSAVKWWQIILAGLTFLITIAGLLAAFHA